MLTRMATAPRPPLRGNPAPAGLYSFQCFAPLLGFAFLRILFAVIFASFVPLADVAKGGDGAKSAFRGYLFFSVNFVTVDFKSSGS